MTEVELLKKALKTLEKRVKTLEERLKPKSSVPWIDSDDELLPQARAVVIKSKNASASYIQRKLLIGYARAARILDTLESQGVIGPAQGIKPRKILLKG